MIETKPKEIHNLICEAHVNLACACLGTLTRLSADPIRLILHDDGSLTTGSVEILRRNLPGCRVIMRQEADAFVAAKLEAYPNCRAFRYASAMALKVLDVYLYSGGDYGFCDSDVMFLRPFERLFEFPDDQVQALFMHDVQNAYCIKPWRMLGSRGLRILDKLNCGLFYVRRSAFDLDFFEALLGRGFMGYPFFWLEQSLWAAWAAHVQTQFWDAGKVMIGQRRELITQDTVAAHFVTNLRHDLDPFIAHAKANAHLLPVTVRVAPGRACSAAGLAKAQARTYLGSVKRKLINGRVRQAQ